MPKIKVVPLTSQQQQSFELCGAAAIRMMLSKFGILMSQADLWTHVKSTSAGGTPVPSDGSLVLDFPNQVCHLCGVWFCWNTTPEAMAATVSDWAPIAVLASPSYPSNADAAVSELIASLEPLKPFPGAASVYGNNHWVVVNGYHMEDSAFPVEQIGARQVNGVYITDPWHGPTPLTHLVPIAEWKRMLKSIDCGPQYVNHYPLVVGSDHKTNIWLRLVTWVRKWWPWPPSPDPLQHQPRRNDARTR